MGHVNAFFLTATAGSSHRYIYVSTTGKSRKRAAEKRTEEKQPSAGMSWPEILLL
jgi:hypothetical protein